MLDPARAEAVAAALRLRLRDLRLCVMCLFGVATELRRGDERKVRSALRFFAPLLWEEGLEAPFLAALRRAALAGVPDAAEALAEVARHGPASRVVKAAVRELAAQQLEEMERFSRTADGPAWLN